MDVPEDDAFEGVRGSCEVAEKNEVNLGFYCYKSDGYSVISDVRNLGVVWVVGRAIRGQRRWLAFNSPPVPA
jgi:hypothetical protein